jgi:hypothetical protein
VYHGIEVALDGRCAAAGLGGLFGGLAMHNLDVHWMWLLACSITVAGWLLTALLQTGQLCVRCLVHSPGRARDQTDSISTGNVQLSARA